MKKTAIFLFCACIVAQIFTAGKRDDFSKGIAYYLINEIELAQKNLDAYFRLNPQQRIKAGFALLLKNEKWEATKVFRDYLETDHRSLEALTGISLAVADMKNDLAAENLYKIIRMNPGFAPAYLCLGQEFFKRKNYPAAEDNFNKALQFAKIAEYKIMLGELYLQTNRPQKAIELIQPEADLAPANFYYAWLAARSFFQLNDWTRMFAYSERALKVKPDSREVQLLQAQAFLKTGELKKAKKILEKLKFNYYNLEYSLTFAEVLLKLKDSDAEKYLYEVFSQNQWEPRVNLLLGLYHLKKKHPSVQNWIQRAILSGKAPEELKSEFPASFTFRNYPYLACFEIKKIQWLSSNRVLVAGNLQSGEKEKLLVIDTVSLKTIKSFDYEGRIQELFASEPAGKIIFSTTAVENEKVYIYTFLAAGEAYSLKPVVGYALKMPTILAAFNANASAAYVTDGSLAEQAFNSPFSTVSAYGRKVAIYPNYPFPVYSYSYANDRWFEIKDRELLRRVPIQAVQQYWTVAEAMNNNPEVAKLLEKGQKTEITSSEETKIYFAASAEHFIIYFSDLKNAFQGLVYDHAGNTARKIDETMFLGEKYYAELEIAHFNPGKKEILFLTKDKQKNLYLFNYHSLLYKKLGDNVLATRSNPGLDTIFFLSEKNKYMYFSECNLEIIRLAPFAREKVSARRDVKAIVDISAQNEQYFSTYNGELLRLSDAENYENCQVALEGSLYQPAPDKKRTAAFINGRLVVLPWFACSPDVQPR